MRLFVAVLALAGAISSCVPVIPAVQAQEHKHGDEVITGATGKFYENWMRPDQPLISCCNRLDCAPVGGVRHVNGRLQALRTKDNVWLTIPPEKIEQNRDSPDGQSHMCSMHTTVFCFIGGAGG